MRMLEDKVRFLRDVVELARLIRLRFCANKSKIYSANMICTVNLIEVFLSEAKCRAAMIAPERMVRMNPLLDGELERKGILVR
jgi:hypothetical protein